jgi:N-acetylglucosaminyldiphosphoundecaprenol N-acetyl-beta-D-mannosaminyltransferase
MRIFAGIPFLPVKPDEAVQAVMSSALSGRDYNFYLVNAFSIASASKNPVYRELLLNSQNNLADGFPIALLSKLGGEKLHHVRGPELFSNVLRESQNSDIRHFFLGGSEMLLGSMYSKIERDFPGVKIAGMSSPPFRKLEPAEVIEQDELIRESTANLVWVSLGTPRQDIEANRIAKKLGVTVVAVGAAFDFFGGAKKEAPKWMSTIGIEWIFRLYSEPRRLWRRYLIGNIVFLLEVVRKRKL